MKEQGQIYRNDNAAEAGKVRNNIAGAAVKSSHLKTSVEVCVHSLSGLARLENEPGGNAVAGAISPGKSFAMSPVATHNPTSQSLDRKVRQKG